jgi:hypothetical protein
MRRSSSARKGQQVAQAIASVGMGAAGDVLGFLDACPDAAPDLIDLIVEEGRRKKPRERLLDGYLMMLAHALEFIRYRVERDIAEGRGQIETVRQRILAHGRAGDLDPAMLLAILGQFGNAKLDVGDELQGFMAELLQTRFGAEAGTLDEHALGRQWAHFAELADGDVFALHDHLNEQAGAFPPEHRIAMAAAMIQAAQAIVREATVGLLLDSESSVRTMVMAAMVGGVSGAVVTGTMLRRMIAMRNWLPAGERPELDNVIRAARKAGVECAAWPAPQVQEVVASPFDGSGAQSLFMVARDGRKFAVVALLIKQGIGVRDAWVRRGLSRRELGAFLAQVAGQIDLSAVTLDHVRAVTKHVLAVGAAGSVMPPFGLIDVAETVGMSDLNPADWSIEDALDALLAEAGLANRAAEATSRLIEDSARWPETHPFTETWFEHDGEVDALLGGRRSTRKRSAALVVGELLPRRRRKWAELIGWTAATMKADKTSRGWEAFAVVARELLADRPLTEFPVMRDIADRTVVAFADHFARG